MHVVEILHSKAVRKFQDISSTVIVCLAVYSKSSGMEKQLSWCDFLEIWNQFRLDRTLVAQRRPGDLAIVMQSWDLAEESDENKMHHVLVKTNQIQLMDLWWSLMSSLMWDSAGDSKCSWSCGWGGSAAWACGTGNDLRWINWTES